MLRGNAAAATHSVNTIIKQGLAYLCKLYRCYHILKNPVGHFKISGMGIGKRSSGPYGFKGIESCWSMFNQGVHYSNGMGHFNGYFV